MKIKTDFVTNSSSASFELYITSDITSVNEFIKVIQALLEYDISREQMPDGNSIKKLMEGVFTFEEYTSMYNGISDIPAYMRTLLLKDLLEKDVLYNKGISQVLYKRRDDHL